jgi:hypothetical protein
MDHVRLALALAAAAACLNAWVGPDARAATRTLVVEAGKHARACVPMSVDLPVEAAKAKLVDQATGKEVPCQLAAGKLWWILDELAAGAAKTYTVESGADSSGDPKAVSLKESDTKIDITVAGQPFTTYHFGERLDWGKEILRPCFFPVLGPDQTPMTRAYPLVKDPPKDGSHDHPHHTSLWVAHGAVNGVDDWSISAGKKDKDGKITGAAGRQLHRGFDAVVSGPVFGEFRERLDWTTADRKPILAEVRTARFYRLPGTIRLLDLAVTFIARYGAVLFGDTKEGGLIATRMRDEFCDDKADRAKLGKDGILINAQGLRAGKAWGKRSEWVDCSGLVGERRYGYAIFDTPGNFRFPTYWHARTYGLVTANPFGIREFDRASGQKGDHTLPEGQELTFRYRVCFHVGDAQEAQVAARYADYAEPPRAEWK